jgi:hypothetical protein
MSDWRDDQLTKYVVIRPAPDLPAGFLPEHLNGRWFDLTWMRSGHGLGTGVAVATGRYESRDDGEVAEVYEVRP